MMPAGTSTNATRAEIRKALLFLYPMEKRGKETELPSGKFWTPIPTDTITACKKADSVPSKLADAKAKPTHIPSGILCRAMPRFNVKVLILESFLLRQAISKINIATYASKKQTGRIMYALRDNSSQYSIAGISKENMLDAIITPPANACKKASNFALNFLTKKIVDAPAQDNKKHNIEKKKAYIIHKSPLHNTKQKVFLCLYFILQEELKVNFLKDRAFVNFFDNNFYAFIMVSFYII